MLGHAAAPMGGAYLQGAAQPNRKSRYRRLSESLGIPAAASKGGGAVAGAARSC